MSRSDSTEPGAAHGIPWLIAAVLAASVLYVYWGVGEYAFVNIDDDLFVTGNPVVLRGLTLEGVSWAFTSHTGNWHPVTWLSHMLDTELFGHSAGWHHRVNVLFHLLNTELLFFVLWRMTGESWRSAFAAALFGVHPLHVESVAWVSERKDLLSALFWISAMAAYLRYARRPGIPRYLLVTALFALGLMSKPVPVTLPFALLLMDWWPLGRIPALGMVRLAGEKVPWLAMSAVSCAVTYMAQGRAGSVLPEESIPAGLRIANATVSYLDYLGKTAWPSSLAVFYPHSYLAGKAIPAWQVAGSLLVLGAATFLALRERRRRPCLAVGWLWFLGTLVPMIGLVQVGEHALADRYTYIPLTGIFLAAVWSVPEVPAGRRLRRIALAALAGTALAALSTAARDQAGYWRDSVTLFSRATAATEGNWLAWNNLGAAYRDTDRHAEAVECFLEALRIRPDYSLPYYNLGTVHSKVGEHGQAIGYYREALMRKPDLVEAFYQMGVSYDRLGRLQYALSSYLEAVRIRPDHPDAWNNLGTIHGRLGRYEDAIACFLTALRIRPDFTAASNNLSVAREKLGVAGAGTTGNR